MLPSAPPSPPTPQHARSTTPAGPHPLQSTHAPQPGPQPCPPPSDGCVFAITLLCSLCHRPASSPGTHQPPDAMPPLLPLNPAAMSQIVATALQSACPQAAGAPITFSSPRAGPSTRATTTISDVAGLSSDLSQLPEAAPSSQHDNLADQVPWQQGGGCMQLEVPCVQAGLGAPLTLRVSAGGSAPGGAVDAVVAVWRGGRLVVESQRVVVAGGTSTFSVTLPPQLDVGPVEFLLMDAAPDAHSALLATATTMALPPGPCREVCAAAAPLPGDAPGIAESLQLMALDIASVWKLQRAQESRAVAEGQAGSGAVEALAARLVEYSGAMQLPATSEFLQQLLGGRYRPGGAGGEGMADDARAGGSGAEPGTDVQRETAAAGSVECRGMTRTEAAAAAVLAGAATVAAPTPAHASSAATPTPTPTPAPQLQPATASTAPPPWHEAQYVAWQQQQGRGADLAACLFLPVAWTVILFKAASAGTPWERLRACVPMALAQVLLSAAALLPLAVGPARLRRQRHWVVGGMSASRAVLVLLAAGCWVAFPKEIQRAGTQVAPMLISYGVLLPVVERVGWRQQLLTNLVLEQLPQYVLHNRPACAADPTPEAMSHTESSWALLLATPLVAALTSWVMECSSRAAFRRLVLASGSVHHPQASSSGNKLKVL